MNPKHKLLIREQLETTMDKLSCLRGVQRPAKGWLRTVREALGMTGKQFARRLNVSPPRVSALEKDELSGGVTLKTMRQAAEALDCVFVYAVIPHESLTKTVRRRARSLADKRLARVSHSMLFEAQQLTDEEQKRIIGAEIERLVQTMPKELWEEHNAI